MQKKLKDNRDNRGKRHNLAFVVLGVLCSIMNGYLEQASIVRNMKRIHKELCKALNFKEKSSISAPQLGRIFSNFDWHHFEKINKFYWGNKNKKYSENGWRSTDGKELRGTIDKSRGEKRGLSVVRVIVQSSSQSECSAYYNGRKASEVTAVRELLREWGVSGKKISLDALHSKPKTMEQIEGGGGIYLTQVKDKRTALYKILNKESLAGMGIYEESEVEKGHGRIEQRQAGFYSLPIRRLPEELKKSNIKTLIVMNRQTEIVKTKKRRSEKSFYISNLELKGKETALELFGAIRGHWGIESDHFIRDTTFGEDAVKTFNQPKAKVLATFLSLATNILRFNPASMKAQIEDNRSDFQYIRNAFEFL